MIKKSFTLLGHATSIRLEAPFWDALNVIAAQQSKTLTALIAQADSHRHDKNLASHLRVMVLDYYKGLVEGDSEAFPTSAATQPL